MELIMPISLRIFQIHAIIYNTQINSGPGSDALDDQINKSLPGRAKKCAQKVQHVMPLGDQARTRVIA